MDSQELLPISFSDISENIEIENDVDEGERLAMLLRVDSSDSNEDESFCDIPNIRKISAENSALELSVQRADNEIGLTKIQVTGGTKVLQEPSNHPAGINGDDCELDANESSHNDLEFSINKDEEFNYLPTKFETPDMKLQKKTFATNNVNKIDFENNKISSINDLEPGIYTLSSNTITIEHNHIAVEILILPYVNHYMLRKIIWESLLSFGSVSESAMNDAIIASPRVEYTIDKCVIYIGVNRKKSRVVLLHSFPTVSPPNKSVFKAAQWMQSSGLASSMNKSSRDTFESSSISIFTHVWQTLRQALMTTDSNAVSNVDRYPKAPNEFRLDLRFIADLQVSTWLFRVKLIILL